ncbi:MAG: hypothetical protein ACK5MP_07750 [Nostocoides sp.]
MRPTTDQLLASLQSSLADMVVPHVEDRWARYVCNAMDLVLEHLRRRAELEGPALAADDADMRSVLASLAALTGEQQTPSTAGSDWADLATVVSCEVPPPADDTLAAETATNEQLRSQIIEVIRWADRQRPDNPDLEPVFDQLGHLVRRQVHRTEPIVEPLYMLFTPAGT